MRVLCTSSPTARLIKHASIVCAIYAATAHDRLRRWSLRWFDGAKPDWAASGTCLLSCQRQRRRPRCVRAFLHGIPVHVCVLVHGHARVRACV
eukprot:366331-Chlamydomonas_euryale.AAC.9